MRSTTPATLGKRSGHQSARSEDIRIHTTLGSTGKPEQTVRYARRSRSRSRSRTPAHKLYDKQLTALAIILILTAVVVLYAAYSIFTATWRHPLLFTQTPKPRITEVQADLEQPHVRKLEQARYLAYLPHSGFHNQRIALENALVLAHMLNRTLLLPPVRLGEPLPYLSFDQLYELSANWTHAGIERCSNTRSKLRWACEGSHTHISWSWLVNITAIRESQPLVEGWDYTDAWLHDTLNISTSNISYLKDSTRNQYVFLDFATVNPPTRKFSEAVSIAMLSRRPERLIQLGTLFGSSRLFLRAEENYLYRKRIREHMTFTNPHLVSVASEIRDALGGTYLGAHLRVRDGTFEWDAPQNMRMAWWKLLHDVLGYTDEQLLEMEQDFFQDEDALESPVFTLDLPAMRSPHPPLPPLPRNLSLAGSLSCRGLLHTAPHLQVLNTPLFIATDAQNPSLNPLLMRFIRTFPCLFFLDDFREATRPLDSLRSDTDGSPLGSLLMPFLDAMVAGQAWQVVGTEQSTFSAFVTDVLWRRYHGFEIVQRG